MHILLLTQYFPPDPDSSRGLPFARWLQDHGHQVTVLTGLPNYKIDFRDPANRFHWRRWEEVEGVRVLRVGLYRRHDRSPLHRMLNYLSFALSASLLGLPRVGRVDCIYVTSTPPTVVIPAWLAGRRWKIPYAVNVVDIWPEAVLDSGMLPWPKLTAPARRCLERMCRRLYGDAGWVSTISEGYARILQQQRFVAPGRLHVVYNAAPAAALAPPTRPQAMAEKLGLQGKFNFLYAGNLGVFQGVETIVAAAEELGPASGCQILIAGAGQCEEGLRRSAAHLPQVRFLGQLPPAAMPDLYACVDALLVHLKDLPFLRATIPGKTQISLAVGRPLVMACAGDAADLVARAGAGLVCAPENPRALAEAMRRLQSLPEAERAAMGERGRQFYYSHLDTAATAPQLELLLRTVAGPPRPA